MTFSIETGAQALERVRAAVAADILGQDAAIHESLIAFLARGHVLIEGVPGTAKTLLARRLARALGVRFCLLYTSDAADE